MSKRDYDQLSFSFPGDEDDLPEGWTWTLLGDLVQPSKEKIDPSDWPEAPYLSLEHIKPDTGQILEHGHASEVRSTKAVFHAGDVLYGKLRPYLNKVAIPDFDGVCSTDILVLPKIDLLENWFLMRFLSRQEVVQYATHHSKGVNLPRISFEKLGELAFPLPPLAEQKRIVAQIGKLLAEVRSTRARLEGVKQILARFRQAVLDAACSGRLTEDWRADHTDVELAETLLERILQERREQWETKELAKYEDKGKKPPKGWQDRYKPPREADATHLPALPESWVYSSSDTLFSFVTSGSRGWAKYYADSGPQFIRVGNLQHDSITLDLTDVQHVDPPEGAEKERTRVQPGDLLISVTADVGMIALVPDTIEESHVNQHVAITRPLTSVHSPFVAWFLMAPSGGQVQFQELQYGVTKSGLGLEDVKSIAVPLPPQEEQQEIVRRVEQLFALADRLEAQVDAVFKRSEKISQSILAKAFRGELVPTEAVLARREGRDYEPASELLKRIQVERIAQEAEQRKRKKKTVAKKTTTKTAPRRPLLEVLADAGQRLTPEQLFTEAGFKAESVEAFYEELRVGVANAQIREVRPNKTEVYLEAATS